MSAALARELATLLERSDAVLDATSAQARPYMTDATESRAVRGRAAAVARPATAAEVAAVVRWCYGHDVPIVARGGGTGYAGGAVPRDGSEVVLSLERLAGPAQLEPGAWRAWVPAGARTADVRRRVREHGLFLPPDPASAESSMIGGNLATNAGGPHSFKYGVTGAWVTGVQVVLAPGDLVEFGGRARKDVAGYDLRSLLIGSEGTLGVLTGAWLRLIPAPAAAVPVRAVYPNAAAGCRAIEAVFAAGAVGAAALGGGHGGFVVIAEADGTREEEAWALRDELLEVLGEGAVEIAALEERAEVAALWRWREGVSLAVTAQRGGKLSEDIVVPVERLPEALAAVLEVGARHGLSACSWGHAGDGNIHATFLIDAAARDDVARAEAAARELFELAARLGGAVSGEHGVGLVKRGALSLQWSAAAVAAHERVKRLFDPKGLLNPGKKLARPA
jgi:FAD/FMN-containing dehydrogenase